MYLNKTLICAPQQKPAANHYQQPQSQQNIETQQQQQGRPLIYSQPINNKYVNHRPHIIYNARHQANKPYESTYNQQQQLPHAQQQQRVNYNNQPKVNMTYAFYLISILHNSG